MLLVSALRRVTFQRNISLMATSSSVKRKRAQSVEPVLPIREESPLTELESDVPAPPKTRKRNTKNIIVDEDNPEETPPKKRSRSRKPKEPVVYDIPPVERKETTFKGRLGYACLNTILRANKPDPIFCSRTCRIDTIGKHGIDFVKNLALQNVRDLAKLIQWNEDNQIRFMRISSELFPYASHTKYGYEVDFAEKELKAAGDLANSFGHRLTAHPGQYTQLASLKEDVVDASVRELSYHARVMELMGLGPDSVMIIHLGGMYGDKPATLARFKRNYEAKLTPQIKARLVLENDEMCYNLDDLMPLCEELDIPIVIDYHHNWIYPSARPLSTLIPLVNATWNRKNIRPKQHLSSPRPGATTNMEKRAHADRCTSLPSELPDEMDLMIEAKDKEQAVFHLYRIYGLASVMHENLRPEKPPVLETSGKKGTSRRKKKEVEVNEDPVVPVEEVSRSTKRKGHVKKKSVTSAEDHNSAEVVGLDLAPPAASGSRRKARVSAIQGRELE